VAFHPLHLVEDHSYEEHGAAARGAARHGAAPRRTHGETADAPWLLEHDRAAEPRARGDTRAPALR
jgi:hypothetical protein